MPKVTDKKTTKRGQSDDYEAATKPGKVRKGRLVDGEVVYDEDEDTEDEDEEEDDEDTEEETDEEEDSEDESDEDDEDDEDDEEEDEDEEEPAPKKKGKPTAKDEKPKAKEKEVEGKLKPSQKPVLPADKRKVADEKITKKSVIVTVKDLEDEFGMDGKKIRRVIRALGYKAPDVNGPADAFGAKKKYEWDSNSKHLKAIKAALDEEQGG